LEEGNMSKRKPRTTKPRSKKGMHLQTLLRRLGGIEQLREFLGSEHNRRAQLEADAVFVRETEELQ
jgi:hypothetical protein